MADRTIRYQGAILRDDHILLLQVMDYSRGETFWCIPGGGREPHESEAACVRREMYEETQLHVEVLDLLLDELGQEDGMYQRLKTYACRILAGEARPGYEPEIVETMESAIIDVGWFDLKQPDTWGAAVQNDPITYSLLQRLRARLGYTDGPEYNG